MKIILNPDEISQIVQDALVDYASQHLVIAEGAEVEVTMLEDGGAAITIQAPINKVSRRKPGRPAKTDKAETAGSVGNTGNTSTSASNRPFQTKEEVPAGTAEIESQGEATASTEEAPFKTDEAPKEEASEEPSNEDTGTDAPEVPPVRSLFSNLRKPVNS